MANDQRSPGGTRRTWRSRSRTERRLIVLGAVTVVVLVVPGLWAAVVELFVGALLLTVLLGLLGVVVLIGVWRVAERHPVVDLVVGAWLLRRRDRRRDRRQERIVDARSWQSIQQRQPYRIQAPPPDPRTWRW